jgi:quercetin dioxygenase-like cupin family protein
MPNDSIFLIDTDASERVLYRGMHGGVGTIEMKRFFSHQPPGPVRFLVYSIPPGASEGDHMHQIGFDEFYYIISGRGEMQIDGNLIPVNAGDHIFTPFNVAHGIKNISSSEDLKVFLTAVNLKWNPG